MYFSWPKSCIFIDRSHIVNKLIRIVKNEPDSFKTAAILAFSSVKIPDFYNLTQIVEQNKAQWSTDDFWSKMNKNVDSLDIFKQEAIFKIVQNLKNQHIKEDECINIFKKLAGFKKIGLSDDEIIDAILSFES